MELSRVLVLASRPVEGSIVNKLTENPTFFTEEVLLDGQGRWYRVVA
jgi:hypothetical protein